MTRDSMQHKQVLRHLFTFLFIVFSIEIFAMQAIAFKSQKSVHLNRFVSLKISVNTASKVDPISFSVAPMMAHTNRHFRKFWRFISKRTELYTEMIVADKIVQADEENDVNTLDFLLGHDTSIENPLTLQLGGNCPVTLERASKIAYTYGYRSINLNCGCPSNTVASSNAMGAALMYNAEITAQCCAAISRSGKDIQVSVKCRTGVDEQDSYEELCNFINIGK
jgi:tRNA-dihydrouridine synthase A